MIRKTFLALTFALTLSSLVPAHSTACAGDTPGPASHGYTAKHGAEATAGYYVWYRFNASQRYTVLGPYSLNDAYSVQDRLLDRGAFAFVTDHP